MTDIEKLEELKKIDSDLSYYIRKHTDILTKYGKTPEQAASDIVNKLKTIIEAVWKSFILFSLVA